MATNENNGYTDFDKVMLSNTPLQSSNSNLIIEKIIDNNITPDGIQPKQMILDFFFSNSQDNSNNKNVNDYITESDLQDILSTMDINHINSKIAYSSNKTDYLKSRPLPYVSQNDFSKYYNTIFDVNDLINLEQQIEILSSNSDLKQTIGPFCSLDHLIELSFKNDPQKYNEMLEKRECMINQIYKWRKVKGDGNCFYRAIIFAFIENIILNKNNQLMINLIMDIKTCYENKLILSKLNIKRDYTIKYSLMMKILMIIYNKMIKNNIGKSYELFVKCILACPHFDYGIILYLRYLLYRYTIENETKLYTENFPVLIGNLLPSEYETEDGKFLFQNYYENYLLKMFKDAEKIVIYLIPFVLCSKLNVVLFDVNQDSLKEFNYYGKDNFESNYSINLVNVRVHYEIIYTQHSYELFQKYYERYQLSPKYTNIVLSIKKENNKNEENVIHSERIVNNDYNINNTNTCNLLGLDLDDLSDQNQAKTTRPNISKLQFIDNKMYHDDVQQFHQKENQQSNTISKEKYNRIKNSMSEFLNNSINIHDNLPDYSKINNLSQENNDTNTQNLQKETICSNYPNINREESSIFELFNDSNAKQVNISKSNCNSNSNNNSYNKAKTITTTTKTLNSNRSNDNYYQTIENNQFNKCSNCNAHYLNQNQFSLCNQCLISEIKSNLLSLFYLFLGHSKNKAFLSKSSFESITLFKSMFANPRVAIKRIGANLEDLMALINKDKQDKITVAQLVKELKSTICLHCEKETKASKCYLPCGCVFCSTKCQLEYFLTFQLILNTPDSKELICLCSHKYSPKEILEVISSIGCHSESFAQHLFDFYKQKIMLICLFCHQYRVNLIQIECENLPFNIKTYVGVKSITHSICQQCYQEAKRKEIQNLHCSICQITHAIKKKDNCIVF